METLRLLSKTKSIVYTSSIGLFLLYQLVPFKEMGLILSIFSIAAIALALLSCTFFTRLMSILFLLLGTIMAMRKGIDVLQYVQLYGDMLYLLALFAIVPLLSIPIQAGGYREDFKQLFQGRIHSSSHLYRIITGLSYFLGSFLNMAAVPITHASVKSTVDSWPIEKPERFLASSIIQGYSLPIMWTPLSGILGVVLYVTNVEWLSIFPALFCISVVTLGFNWLIFSLIERFRKSGSHQKESSEEEQVMRNSSPLFYRKMSQIMIAIIVLLCLIVAVDMIFSMGLVVTVTLLTVPFAWLWCRIIKNTSDFWPGVKHHFTHKITEMSESFAIFLSAGFFVQALHFSGNDRLVNELFVHFNELVGAHVFLISLPFLTLLFSFIGMHPIVVVNLLAQSLKPDVLGITSEQMAVAFLGGAVLTFYLGPFSGTLGLMSSIINVRPMRIAGWSLLYAAAFSLVVTVSVFLL
ncbi:hypothetical protein [Domibacillus epiphyticus]|uniref:Uncharacterized protein n=1 Tax=Domibacillus epiphyticus TaxID=1714355 RepID=A0A1V2ABS3_9BACI|nr:hypothetical protein [Domibacillus epiphyticus]OMP68443.1 hypothetical protein BTO28_02140 [Domibacillus epiphyticus]